MQFDITRLIYPNNANYGRRLSLSEIVESWDIRERDRREFRRNLLLVVVASCLF